MPAFSETLISPDGREVTATSAGEYNDLRYGRGYRPKETEQPAKKSAKSQKSDKDDTK